MFSSDVRTGGRQLCALWLAIIVVLSVVTVAGVAGVASAASSNGHGHNGVTEIDSCIIIDEPGRYVLIEDIEDSEEDVCIDVRSIDVVFDGNGHTIDGDTPPRPLTTGFPPLTSVGIGANIDESASITNITVTDVQVTNWNYGVAYNAIRGGTVEQTTASENVLGIALMNSSYSTVTASTGNRNGALGVFVTNGSDNTLTNLTAESNQLTGIALEASDSTLSDSTAVNNTVIGIGVFERPNLTATDNVVHESGLFGILVENATDSSFANNTIADTRGFTAPGEQPTGLRLDNVTNTITEENTVTGTDGPGIVLTSEFGLSTNNALIDNTVSDTSQDGIVIEGARGAVLIRNGANENAVDGVTVTDSENVAAVLNTVTDNGDDGIDVTDSNSVVLLFNELDGNGDQAVEVNDSENVLRLDSLEDLEELLDQLLH